MLLKAKNLFSKTKYFEDFAEIQQSQRIKYQKKYIGPYLFNHQDILMEQQLYGRKCYVGGSTPNNMKSATFIRQLVGFVKPNHIILGGLSPTDGKVNFKLFSKNSSTPIIYQPEKMYCKNLISQHIQRHLQKDQNFSYDDQKKCFFIIDHKDKRITTNDYLTAGYESILNENCKLSFGLPSDIIVFEDLILSHSLDEIKDIFYRSIGRLKKNYHNEYVYSFSIVLDLVRQDILFQEPTLYSKQKLFTTALLRRHARITDKTLAIVPNCLAKAIGQQVHKVNIQPQKIYRNFMEDKQSQNYEKLNKMIFQNKVEELLEKFAILTFIKKQNLEKQLKQGQNIFLQSIFRPMFSNLSIETIHSLYKKVKANYFQQIWDIQAFFMKNIAKNYPRNLKIMTLKEHFALVDERRPNFPISFIASTYPTIQHHHKIMVQLHEKMIDMVIKQGNPEDIELLQEHLQGKYTKQSIILYSKMIGKASIQMPKKVKLPVYHYQAFRGVYKQYLRDFILSKNVRKQESSKLKPTKEQLQMLQNYKLLDDPEEIQQFLSGKKGKLLKSINLYEDQQDKVMQVDADPKDIEQLMQMMNDEKKNQQ